MVGLGYVGLPLAAEFGKIVPTIGFDLNKGRIADLKKFKDANNETSSRALRAARFLECTNEPQRLKEAACIIVAVPTPVNGNKQPDLRYVVGASETVGKNLSRGTIVVYESTVYPGVTEDICTPLLEKHSGLIRGKEFKVAYSPERINPGDREHTLRKVVKVVSADDPETLEAVAGVYGMIVDAGVYKAESIKVAEAAKVIENTQRDLNIALMNELSIIFHRIGIDTVSVLKAAATKWNFIAMIPGLVGGHCIGVDPYYLTFKAEKSGYRPQVILAGRRINDGMGKYIVEETVKCLTAADKTVKGSRVLVAGMTFKENVNDIRNSRVIDIITELRVHGAEVIICDPLAHPDDVRREYGVELTGYSPSLKVDCVIIAVAHTVFKKELTVEAVRRHLGDSGAKGVVVDVKGMFEPAAFKRTGIVYWRL